MPPSSENRREKTPLCFDLLVPLVSWEQLLSLIGGVSPFTSETSIFLWFVTCFKGQKLAWQLPFLWGLQTSVRASQKSHGEGDFWNYFRNDLSFHSNPALWSHHHIPGLYFHRKGYWRNQSLLDNHSRGRDGLHLPCPPSLLLLTLLLAHLACLSVVWKQRTPTQHSLVISTPEKTGSC